MQLVADGCQKVLILVALKRALPDCGSMAAPSMFCLILQCMLLVLMHSQCYALMMRQNSLSVTQALVDLDNRFFGGRQVSAVFFPEERLEKNDLGPKPGD